MRDKLRRRYQAQKEVARNGYFEGEIAIAELGRLGDLLHRDNDGGRLAVRFEFVRNEMGAAKLVGELRASLDLECQRCLEPMTMPLRQEIELLIDADEDRVRESGIDTIFSEDGFIDIYSVIEDELILAIPLVALHEDTACNEHWPVVAVDGETEKGDNPFAVLRQLKTTD